MLANFWWWLTVACLVWYCTIAVYVGIRGASDIKGMLGRLRDINLRDEASEADRRE